MTASAIRLLHLHNTLPNSLPSYLRPCYQSSIPMLAYILTSSPQMIPPWTQNNRKDHDFSAGISEVSSSSRSRGCAFCRCCRDWSHDRVRRCDGGVSTRAIRAGEMGRNRSFLDAPREVDAPRRARSYGSHLLYCVFVLLSASSTASPATHLHLQLPGARPEVPVLPSLPELREAGVSLLSLIPSLCPCVVTWHLLRMQSEITAPGHV